jgi:hypothetical protein
MLRGKENRSDESRLTLHQILNASDKHLFSGPSYVGVRKLEPYKGSQKAEISDWNNGSKGLHTGRNL